MADRPETADSQPHSVESDRSGPDWRCRVCGALERFGGCEHNFEMNYEETASSEARAAGSARPGKAGQETLGKVADEPWTPERELEWQRHHRIANGSEVLVWRNRAYALEDRLREAVEALRPPPGGEREGGADGAAVARMEALHERRRECVIWLRDDLYRLRGDRFNADAVGGAYDQETKWVYVNPPRTTVRRAGDPPRTQPDRRDPRRRR